MSIRKIAYDIIDNLTEEQIKGFILMCRGIVNMEIPNEETLEAFAEVEDMKKNSEKYKGYSDVDEMMGICWNEIYESDLILYLIRNGTHSNLFS